MQFTVEQMPIRLTSKAPLNIVGGHGSSVRVLRGRIWITQEGSIDDVFLNAGQSHTLEADGKVIISAEGPARSTATVAFDAPLSIQSRPTLGAFLGRLLRWRPPTPSMPLSSYEGI